MHKYMTAIGFSKMSRNSLNELIRNIADQPQQKKITKNSDGESFAEHSIDFADNIGVAVRGIYDEKGIFIPEYYYPYLRGSEITTEENIDIEKHSDKESYAGICDDMHLGVTLVFYMQNVTEYLELQKNKKSIKGNGAILAALSTEGKILLPIADHARVRKTAYRFNEKTKQASESDNELEELMEKYDSIEMDTYEMISRRVEKNEDIFSIVSSTFMPEGIETDQYSILGEIVGCKLITNIYSKERIWWMMLHCNGLNFEVCINESDLLGVPEEGRRFRGKIWMQGIACF